MRDVEGNRLQDNFGQDLNVYNDNLKCALESEQLKLYHDIKNGYRYFTTSKCQRNKFLFDLEYGSEEQNVVYYVYADEDIGPLKHQFKPSPYLLRIWNINKKK